MNALNRDLTALVRHVEREGLALANADPRRLGYHLMPPVGWMNDPNGLCWYQGNYHVFFQYSPFNANRGVIFWGHWSSPDLLHWQQLPVFLCPDQPWNVHGVFSGSALVEDDALYLYYTGSVKHMGDYDYINSGRDSNTALAITRDGVHADSNRLLLTNKDYPADASCHVRDPKVWKQDGKYYMVLGERTTDGVGKVLVYESDDKLCWTHINTLQTPQPFGYMWECPDLFEIDGQTILAVSPQGVAQNKNHFQNIYSCGYFPLHGDFRSAYTLGAYQEADLGFDYYAPQSFLAPDGRRIVLGWMGMPDASYKNPTADENGWQHAMTVPRELHWNGRAVTAQPIRELEQLRRNRREFSFDGTAHTEYSARADMEIVNLGTFLRLTLGDDLQIMYADGLLRLHLCTHSGYGRTMRVAEVGALQELRILLDSSSCEIFLNGGEQVMTTRFYPGINRQCTFEGKGLVELYDMGSMEFAYAEEKEEAH